MRQRQVLFLTQTTIMK